MKPTPQAQDAIQRLINAGWERNQFSVQTDRIYIGRTPDGKNIYEHSDAIITLKNSTKSQRRRKAKAMADCGLHVRLWKWDDGTWGWPFISNAYWAKPGIYIASVNGEQKKIYP